VPDGFVAVVRDMRVYGNFASDADISVGVTVAGPLTGIIWFLNPLSPGATASWEGRVVMNASDELTADSSEAGALLVVSGYLLEVV
jgi:hypothetical protein